MGTAEHDKVADELVARLEQWGYHVKREPFKFSTALNALLALTLSLHALAVLSWLLTRQLGVVLIDLLVIAFAVLIGRSISGYAITSGQPPWRERIATRLGKHFTASNLVAEFPQEQQPPRAVYLVAHYDSKSQRWPLVMRIALFTLLLPGTLLVIGAAIFNVASGLSDVLAVAAIVASALLVLLGTGNASPGAIDNASGVGVVLHLAECLAARSDWRERLRVIVLLTSAEELGLMGATAFVKQQVAQLQSEKALILNFDGVGVDGELQWVGAASSELAQTIATVAREESISIERFRFIGALFDHIPFAQRGLDAVSLITVGHASRLVHTSRDAIDQLHVRGFDQTGRVALRVIRQLVDQPIG